MGLFHPVLTGRITSNGFWLQCRITSTRSQRVRTLDANTDSDRNCCCCCCNNHDETATEAATTTQVNSKGDEQQDPCSSPSFFKAGVEFLAWARWGHIPLSDGAQMISHLFSPVNAKKSYRRGTSTRSAMRKAVVAASAAPVDNRRGRKREIDTGIAHVQPAAGNNAAEFAPLAKKTLDHLADEAMEKEEKQHHYLRVCLVRDKLAAARRRRSEVFRQRLNLSSKTTKKPDTTLFHQMEANEVEIKNLETELVTLQEEECHCNGSSIRSLLCPIGFDLLLLRLYYCLDFRCDCDCNLFH